MPPLLPEPPGPEDGATPEMVAAIAALREVMLAAQAMRQAIATGLGVTFTDTIAMSYLSAEGSLTAGELAVRMDLAASSMTSVLDRLEKAGVARREPHPVDRRAVAVVITEQGHQALRWSRHWLGAALLDLSPDDVATTTDVLSRLADSLRRQTATIERATSSGTSEPDE